MRRAAVVVVAALVAGVVSSCTTSGPPRVVLVTYEGYVLPPKAAAAFERATGAKVVVRAAGDVGEALNKAILTSGHPEGDVFFGVDNTFLSRAVASGAFVAGTAPRSPDTTAGTDLDRTGAFTPIDVGDVCVNADAAWFDAHHLAVPATLDDLAAPAYRGLLEVENPARSSPGLAFLAATRARFGSGTDDYWRRLRANGVEVADGWSTAYEHRYTVSGGDRPLVVSYASSPPAEVVYSDGKRTTPASVVLTGTCFRQIEFAGVLAGADHPDLAKRLVAAMLSPAWQAELPLTNFVVPAVEGTPLPPVFEQFVPRVDAPLTVAPSELGARREAWIDAWRSVME